MKLPRLFKTTKTKAIQICDIATSVGTFTVTFGQLDGKLQTKTTTCLCKNGGRSNSTTPCEQAILEAQAKWEKKVKAGYTTDQTAPVSVQLPQKVKTYVGNENKITFPAYSTYKYNGVNATYWLQADGTLKLTSRGGNKYPPIPHLEKSIRYLMSLLEVTSINGELYIHGQHLQDITSAVKKPKDLSKQLTFRFFAVPDYRMCKKYVMDPYTAKSFKYLASWLQILDFSNYDSDRVRVIGPKALVYYQDKNVEPVKLVPVKNKAELEAHYNKAMSEGYEGTVIYNKDAEYRFNERSSSVYKYKKTIDAEFLVYAFDLDNNNHAVYHCHTPKGKSFKVKRKGTNEERTLDAQNASNNLGSWLKVEFETYSKDLIPLKPVGLCFRDCGTSGEPLE